MQQRSDILIKIFSECRKKKLKIVSAESCTGGLISSLITNVPGSSEFFEKGLVTYSNQSKIELLKVKATTLIKFGAVSKEVVEQMAKGSLNKSESDKISIAVTGVAGPGKSDSKPEGLVWIASYKKGSLLTKKLCLGSLGREGVRNETTKNALALLLENLIV